MKKFLIILLGVAILAVVIFASRSYVLRGSSGSISGTVRNGGGAVASAPVATSSIVATPTVDNAPTVVQDNIFSPVTDAVGNAAADVGAAVAGGVTTAKTDFAGAFNGTVDALRSTLGIPNESAPASSTVSAVASGTVVAPLLGSAIARHGTIQFVVGGDLFRMYGASEASVAVDWGDGSHTVEQLYASTGNSFLSHKYDIAGTYRPVFAFVIASTSVSYEFTVVVL